MEPTSRRSTAQCLLFFVALLAPAGGVADDVQAWLGPAGEAHLVGDRPWLRREGPAAQVMLMAGDWQPSALLDVADEASAPPAKASVYPSATGAKQSPVGAGSNSTAAAAGTTDASKTDGYLPTKKDPAATSSAVMLLGMVCFVMLLFYLVNSTDKDIRGSTWGMLSSGLSIFCTLLLFNSVKTVWMLTIQDPKKGKSAGFYIMNWSLFLLAFVSIPALLLRFLKRPLPLAAWGTIGAHFIGFGGVDAFGYLLQKAPFADNMWMQLLGVLMFGKVLGVMNFLAGKARHWYANRDGTVDEWEEGWNHQCEHTETEYTGFIMGLLISMWARFCITGAVPELHGVPKIHPQSEVLAIIRAASISLAVNIAIIGLLYQLTRPERDHRVQRFAHIVIEISSMTTGWMVLFAAEWWFWSFTEGKGINGDASLLTASMVMALCFSLLAFFVLHVIDFVADRMAPGSAEGVRQLNNAFTLLVGFSWEITFYIAIKGIGAQYASPGIRCLSMVGPMLGMCIIVLPAWILYIVPHTLHGSGHDGHGHGHGKGTEGDHGEHSSHDDQDHSEGHTEGHGEGHGKSHDDSEHKGKSEDHGGKLAPRSSYSEARAVLLEHRHDAAEGAHVGELRAAGHGDHPADQSEDARASVNSGKASAPLAF